jgi:hypothetical protein
MISTDFSIVFAWDCTTELYLHIPSAMRHASVCTAQASAFFRRHISIYFCIVLYLLVCIPFTTFRFITLYCSQWMKYSQVCRPLGLRHNVLAASDLASSFMQFDRTHN